MHYVAKDYEKPIAMFAILWSNISGHKRTETSVNKE